MNDRTSDPKPATRWLAIGAAAGLALAGYGLLQRSPHDTPLPSNAVARVNDVIIDAERFQRAVHAFTITTGTAPTGDDRARMLMQLVEEELLVQRGIELGMPKSETTVRAAIMQSLIASVTAEADATDPDDAALEAYLQEHADRYTMASAFAVDAWIADDEWQAQDFLARLRRDDAADDNDAVRRVPGLPIGLIAVERLRMFVGPAIAAATDAMPIGESAVFVRQGRWYIVRVAERGESVVASLGAVRSQVLIDFRRDLADARLRVYLDDLLQQADVTIAVSPATDP